MRPMRPGSPPDRRDAPPLLVALRRVADRVWYLEQMAGPGNAAPPEEVRSGLLRDLAAAGLRIVAADPSSALGRLEQRARSGRAAQGGEPVLDDEDDDPAEVVEAAA